MNGITDNSNAENNAGYESGCVSGEAAGNDYTDSNASGCAAQSAVAPPYADPPQGQDSATTATLSTSEEASHLQLEWGSQSNGQAVWFGGDAVTPSVDVHLAQTSAPEQKASSFMDQQSSTIDNVIEPTPDLISHSREQVIPEQSVNVADQSHTPSGQSSGMTAETTQGEEDDGLDALADLEALVSAANSGMPDIDSYGAVQGANEASTLRPAPY